MQTWTKIPAFRTQLLLLATVGRGEMGGGGGDGTKRPENDAVSQSGSSYDYFCGKLPFSGKCLVFRWGGGEPAHVHKTRWRRYRDIPIKRGKSFVGGGGGGGRNQQKLESQPVAFWQPELPNETACCGLAGKKNSVTLLLLPAAWTWVDG